MDVHVELFKNLGFLITFYLIAHAHISIVIFVLFCFVLLVLQLSVMPQWVLPPLRGLSRTYTMGPAWGIIVILPLYWN